MLKLTSLLLLLAFFLIANAHKDPLVVPGRTVMVHLFEWKWNDIALECERFLGPKGYAGVQISPPMEHAVVNNPYRPWWQRYQPVSYKLVSRSGNEQQLRDMVSRCNAAGVRIYADAIINHMANSYESGYGSGGSQYNAGIRQFPIYSYQDFNDAKCRSGSGSIENYNDIYQVRDCKLGQLTDLKAESEYVRNKIAEYMNSLIDIGVAGFRIDAAKHMWPGDLQAIFGKLKNAREDIFGPNKRPFIYQEVIDLGFEAIKNTEYTPFARVTEFKYGSKLSEVISKRNGQKLSFLKNFGEGWGFIPGSDSIAFIDNHDNQRGHGGGGPILTHFESRNYKLGLAFMMAWPYGFAQLISSYSFIRSQDDQGPPHNPDGSTKDVIVNPDDTCGNGWVCEHRWRQIYNMAKFRNVAGLEPVQNWWDNGSNQIAFSRGNKAFIAINHDSYGMDVLLKTGLPSGDYCDIISGNKVDGGCTGKKIHVNTDGTTKVNIKYFEEDPQIAIHLESKL